jgi:hypothetical protein
MAIGTVVSAAPFFFAVPVSFEPAESTLLNVLEGVGVTLGVDEEEEVVVVLVVSTTKALDEVLGTTIMIVLDDAVDVPGALLLGFAANLGPSLPSDQPELGVPVF